MLYYNWALFLLLLGVGPLVLLTNRHFHPRLSRLSRAAAESSSRLTGNLVESVRGMRGHSKASPLVSAAARKFSAATSRSWPATTSFPPPSRRCMCHSSTSAASSSSRAMLVVGGYGALHGFAGMNVGSLIAFFFLPALFFQSLQQLGNLYTQTVTSMVRAERVFQLIDLET